MSGSDSDIFDSLADLDNISFLDDQNGRQMLAPPPVADQPPHHHQVAPVDHIQEPPEAEMSPDDEFVPYPPTEQEIAPFRCFFQIIPASAHPTHQNAHPDHIDQDTLLAAETHDQHAPNKIMEEYNTDGILLPSVITYPPTGSEPDHQPPPQQGAPGQDDSMALVLVPNTSSTPPIEPRNKEVVIDIESDSESDPICPVSCQSPSGRRYIFNHGETTDEERTETDDDVLPSPPPPQQSLEQQLASAINEIYYWSQIVNRGIQGEPERPDWLPEGWEIKCVTRTNGSSAGNRDKYYIEPGIKRRQFRSKREVLDFIATGKRRQYKRKANSTGMPSIVNRPFEGTSSSSLQNIRTASDDLEASASRQNEETPNLDSDTVPEKQNEETPNVDSDQNPPKRPRGSPSKSLRDRMTGLREKKP